MKRGLKDQRPRERISWHLREELLLGSFPGNGRRKADTVNRWDGNAPGQTTEPKGNPSEGQTRVVTPLRDVSNLLQWEKYFSLPLWHSYHLCFFFRERGLPGKAQRVNNLFSCSLWDPCPTSIGNISQEGIGYHCSISLSENWKGTEDYRAQTKGKQRMVKHNWATDITFV